MSESYRDLIAWQKARALADVTAFKHLDGMMEELGRVLNGLINSFQAQIERVS